MTKTSHQIKNKATRMQILMFKELISSRKSDFDGMEEAYHNLRRDWMKLTNYHLPASYAHYRTLLTKALHRKMKSITLSADD